MTVREQVEQVLGEMPDDQVRQVLDFALFLSWREEQAAWRQWGQMQLARAYGTDEPEYSEADLKPESST